MKIRNQEGIDTLSVEYRILQHMTRYQGCDDALKWDSNSISYRLGIESKLDVTIILNQLYDIGHVSISSLNGIQWFITKAGIDAFEAKQKQQNERE